MPFVSSGLGVKFPERNASWSFDQQETSSLWPCQLKTFPASNIQVHHNADDPQYVTNAKAININSCSRLHPVAILLVELVPSGGELLRHDVAQVHQVAEAFFQSFQRSSGFWEKC